MIHNQGGFMENRIKELRQQQGLTQDQLAKRIGSSNQYLGMIEKGKRRLSDVWIGKLCVVFKVPVGELFADNGLAPIQNIEVVGNVQAGHWKDMDEIERFENGPTLISADPRYPDRKQFALQVCGTSMNQIFQDGDFAICVEAFGREPVDQSLVVVRRDRHGLIEQTLKRLHIAKNGDMSLLPESDDPLYKDKLSLDVSDPELETVEIFAYVIGKYEQL